ncbi:NAD(P)H-binding protein [Curtobacterium flaccumfaciens]|uniref:NAD(P)H-binding protein n=1 Tax=Curtobacterium flaccumfaciens TaxID=2035 RepID=UPI00220061C1|nr:NAD(P)H-binding protein [Curtobacterium flaccumfaciens]UWD79233.1 NAD(P)H-binding protein [Curtobacterium flaccumfaciens]
MIVVTGASGSLNGATLDHLLTAHPASDLVAVGRDTDKLARFARRGVEVRRGDYADPASLMSAFAGADQLLLVSSSDPGANVVALHADAIDAAAEVGVGRVLYTSHQGAALDNPFAPAREHAATEQLLASSGLAWTALRNGAYAHMRSYFLGNWRETGLVEVPADGPVSWTSRSDLAEAAARILLSGGQYDGPTTLTAPETWSFAEMAELASVASGRTITLRVIGEDAWIRRQVEAGQPEFLARFMVGFYLGAEEGFYAGTGPLLGTLLQRAPHSIRDLFIAEH